VHNLFIASFSVKKLRLDFPVCSGMVAIPGSKSQTQRVVACALLAEGITEIRNPGHCDDVEACLAIASALGAEVTRSAGNITIKGGFNPEKSEVNCRESALAMRLFTFIAALQDKPITVNAGGSLLNRPLGISSEILNKLNLSIIYSKKKELPPFIVKGPLKSTNLQLDGTLTSQILSGLLVALTQTEGTSSIKVENLKSRPYIDLTLNVLRKFSAEIVELAENYFIISKSTLRPCVIDIEGDWSNAAFLLGIAAVSGKINMRNLSMSSCQGDKKFINVLKECGVNIEIYNDTLSVSKGCLKGFTFDASASPDLFPPLVALAARCSGISEISGVSRLFNKESNRAVVLQKEFAKAGLFITIKNDSMYIHGNELKSCEIDSHGDHRIAMSAAQLFAGTGQEVIISGFRSVDKSYPDFWRDLESLGARITYE